MTTQIYPTAVEATDESGDLVFKVELFDECAATIDLKRTTHNLESWRELSGDVEKALIMLGVDKADGGTS